MPNYFNILLFLLIPFLSISQVNENHQHTHSVGLTVVKTLPVFGVGYRYETKKRFMFDFDFGITNNPGPLVKSRNTGYYNLSEISILYEIGKPSRTDFYLYLANGLLKKSIDYMDDLKKDETKYYTKHTIGFGVEFLILKKIGFNISMGLLSIASYNDWWGSGAQIAVYYKF